MDVLSFRDYCLSLPLTEETTPFDETTLVYKIGGKMYACADMETFEWIAVSAIPTRPSVLREQYAEVNPAFHFNKVHWNGIGTAGDLPTPLSANRSATPTCWSCGRASRPAPAARRYCAT